MAPAKSSTSLNAMHIYRYIRIVTFRNTLIQIHTNVVRNLFLPNIVHAKCKYVYSIWQSDHDPKRVLLIFWGLQPGPHLTVVNFSFWDSEYIPTIWCCCLTFWKWILTIQLLTWFLSQGCKELSCLSMDFSLWPLFLSCKWSW